MEELTIEQAKINIDYDRQVSMVGEERAYMALQFYMLGAGLVLEQLEIESNYNNMLILECEYLKDKNKELKDAVEWALNNCKPERDELHSDFFNILTNAANDSEIDEEIQHVRNKNGYQ